MIGGLKTDHAIHHGMLRSFLPVIALSLFTACNTIAAAIAPEATAERAALKSGAYVLDNSHTAVTFKINHLGFSNYVGRFETVTASLDFDEDDPSSASLEAIIDISSLDVANDDFAETLIGSSWFDSEKFPEAVFRSTGITITGETTGKVLGDLTLKGVTQPVALDVTFNGGDNDPLRGGYAIGFSASGSFNRSDFGITRFLGPVSDEVKIEIETEFVRN